MFRARVWEIVQAIPPGRVATYGQIAHLALKANGLMDQKARAFGPRWVGGAMASSPPGIPWQRVINSQGKISLKGANQSEQRILLESEGVVFDERGRIDLNIYQWDGAGFV